MHNPMHCSIDEILLFAADNNDVIHTYFLVFCAKNVKNKKIARKQINSVERRRKGRNQQNFSFFEVHYLKLVVKQMSHTLRPAIGEVAPKYIEIRLGKETFTFLYESSVCISFK